MTDQDHDAVRPIDSEPRDGGGSVGKFDTPQVTPPRGRKVHPECQTSRRAEAIEAAMRLVGVARHGAMLFKIGSDGPKVRDRDVTFREAARLAVEEQRAFAVVIRAGLLVVDADDEQHIEVERLCEVMDRHEVRYVRVESSPGRFHVYIPLYGVDGQVVDRLKEGLKTRRFDGVRGGGSGERIRPPWSPHPDGGRPAVPVSPRGLDEVKEVLVSQPDGAAIRAVADVYAPADPKAERRARLRPRPQSPHGDGEILRLEQSRILDGHWQESGAESRSEALFSVALSVAAQGLDEEWWIRRLGFPDHPVPLVATMMHGGQLNRRGSSRIDERWFREDFRRTVSKGRTSGAVPSTGDDVKETAKQIRLSLAPDALPDRWWSTSGKSALEAILKTVEAARRWDVGLSCRQLAEASGVTHQTARARLQNFVDKGVLLRVKPAKGANAAIYRVMRRHPIFVPPLATLDGNTTARPAAMDALGDNAFRWGGDLGPFTRTVWAVLTDVAASTREVADAVGKSRSHTFELLRRLEAAGLAVRDEDGRWTAAQIGDAEVRWKLNVSALRGNTHLADKKQRDRHSKDRAGFRAWRSRKAWAQQLHRSELTVVDPSTGTTVHWEDLPSSPGETVPPPQPDRLCETPPDVAAGASDRRSREAPATRPHPDRRSYGRARSSEQGHRPALRERLDIASAK